MHERISNTHIFRIYRLLWICWQLRDTKVHREQALKAEKAVTKSERVKIEREVGVRYSDLLRLPYLDIVRCHIIDPMHNLFLGTAKNVTSLWKETGILTDSSFIAIQEKIDSLKVPACIGRLPGNIASGFSGFTAEQWMLWTIVYSPFVLKNIIPSEHYDMWCVFSLGCSLLCRPFIQQRELVKADELLMKFCKMFEDVFEPSRVTPNYMRIFDNVLKIWDQYIPFGVFLSKDIMASLNLSKKIGAHPKFK